MTLNQQDFNIYDFVDPEDIQDWGDSSESGESEDE